MSKLKLMTIVGTRPEVIKMSAIIKKLTSILTTFLYIQVRIMITS